MTLPYSLKPLQVFSSRHTQLSIPSNHPAIFLFDSSLLITHSFFLLFHPTPPNPPPLPPPSPLPPFPFPPPPPHQFINLSFVRLEFMVQLFNEVLQLLVFRHAFLTHRPHLPQAPLLPSERLNALCVVVLFSFEVHFQFVDPMFQRLHHLVTALWLKGSIWRRVALVR